MIRDNKWPIVALLEFEHGTLRPAGRRGAADVRLLQAGGLLVSRRLLSPRLWTNRVLGVSRVARRRTIVFVYHAGAEPATTSISSGRRWPIRVMQQAKETYVVFGCAYCHGVTLTPRGEATDLMHSALVGSDTNGDRIAALLRAGIPQTAKLSPMPQFSDLSDRQLHDIAQLHPLRAPARTLQGNCRGEPRQLATPPPGRRTSIRTARSCHAADLNGIGKKYDATAMRDHLLEAHDPRVPAGLHARCAERQPARDRPPASCFCWKTSRRRTSPT